jgi:hypothetical protein
MLAARKNGVREFRWTHGSRREEHLTPQHVGREKSGVAYRGIRTPALCLEAFNQLFMFVAVFLSLRYVFLTERGGQWRRHRTSRMADAVCSRSNGNA